MCRTGKTILVGSIQLFDKVAFSFINWVLLKEYLQNTKVYKALRFTGLVLSDLKVYRQYNEVLASGRIRSKCPGSQAFLLLQAGVENEGPLVYLLHRKNFHTRILGIF